MVESVVYTEIGSRNRSGNYKDCKQVKHFVNKSMGKRYIVYLLKLYYIKLPDAEIDLVILKSFMYPPHVQFNFPHTHVTVVSIIVVSMFCHRICVSVLMNHGTRKL